MKKQQELPDEAKAEIEKQLSDPLHTSDSKIAHLIKDYWEHPEKFKWYRDHVMLPTVEEKYFPDRVDDNPHDWKVEIPIITGTF